MRTLVLSGMALIAATYGLARFGYGLFLPEFTESFRLSSTLSGVSQAGSFLAYCLAAVVAARLSARPRTVVVCAGTTAALGALGVAAAPHAIVLAVSVLVAGAGAGFATPGLVTLVERNVAPDRQERAQTVVNAGTGAGIVVAGVLLLTVGHWRLGWVAIAALTALATLATLRADRARTPGAAAHGTVRVRELTPLARPLVAAALAGLSSAGIWTFGRSVMASSQGDEAQSVYAWMVLGAFGVLGAVAGKLVQAWSLRTAWTTTTVAMAAATVLLGLAPGAPLAAYTSVALFGASYTAMSGVLIVWAARALSDRTAEGTIALFIMLAIGQAAGSVVLGALLGASTPAVAFAVAGVAGVAAVLPALRQERTPAREAASASSR